MEDKIKIIDEIVKRHPSYGVKKGWSWYTGGMKDTGDWYYRKMLDVSTAELQLFLDGIVEGENKPKVELTEQEKIDSSIIHKVGNSWMNERNKKFWEDFQNECDKRILGL